MSRGPNPLNRDASTAEATLLDVIYEAYVDHGQWPHFQYVDATLYNKFGKLDAGQLILGCPQVSIAPAGIGSYGWVRGSDTRRGLLPADEIALTVAGLAHLPQAVGLVTAFLKTLAYFVRRERSITPSPISVQTVTVTSKDIQLELSMGASQVDPLIIPFLGRALQGEPSTWSCGVQSNEDGSWTATLGSFLRQYEGVETTKDYLDRLIEQLQPSSTFDELVSAPDQEGASSHEFDFFISHASDDKDEIARPLFVELTRRGYRVWFDEAELVVGQSLVQSIDRGLATCDHGIVILSPAFFGKKWPERELAGLVQRAMAGEEQVILPVWHHVTQDDVRSYSAPLADIVAVNSSVGTEAVADALEGGAGRAS